MRDRPTVLVPLRVLEGESIPEGVPGLLANARVVLLGYHVVPEQTAPGQARMQFEDRAVHRLDEFETILEAAGAVVESRLVFTHDGQKTIDRTIHEYDCHAVLVSNATGSLEDVLVAIRGTVGLDRLVRLLSGLFADTDVDVTLYHVVGEDEPDEDARSLLDGVEARLSEAGMDAESIDSRIGRGRNPLDELVAAADEFDAIVVGESDPSLATFLFGMPTEQVADRFLGPVLVVQRDPSAEDGDEDGDR